jgi:hypothetical protein
MGLLIRCGNKNAVFTTGWKKFAKTEKDAVGQVKHESHVDRFSYIEGVVHTWGKQWITGIISKCQNV